MIETVSCKSQPMLDWVKGEGRECRPCLIAPVVQWYNSELEETGHKELAGNLVKCAERGDPEEMCRCLDEAKAQVAPELAERLREFDCAVQSYQSSDEGGEQNEG